MHFCGTILSKIHLSVQYIHPNQYKLFLCHSDLQPKAISITCVEIDYLTMEIITWHVLLIIQSYKMQADQNVTCLKWYCTPGSSGNHHHLFRTLLHICAHIYTVICLAMHPSTAPTLSLPTFP